ncbi:hypothetical protein [uncultured Methanomethylovorans sp.]|uniref:hypothetical protein n=1 Tax=uncultured Methanomethylovorans sp. TaxID=183759 RepID=UPI002AA87A08|nr:hypothetical protein [uncultured Methanomethylovorans sp.]
MKSKVYTDSEEATMDFSGLVFRACFTIMQNEAYGNKRAVYDIINYLGTIMHPFQDKQYNETIEELANAEKPKGKTANDVRIIEEKYTHNFMYGKYEALMDLAYRRGFLPATKNQHQREESNV